MINERQPLDLYNPKGQFLILGSQAISEARTSRWIGQRGCPRGAQFTVEVFCWNGLGPGDWTRVLHLLTRNGGGETRSWCHVAHAYWMERERRLVRLVPVRVRNEAVNKQRWGRTRERERESQSGRWSGEDVELRGRRGRGDRFLAACPVLRSAESEHWSLLQSRVYECLGRKAAEVWISQILSGALPSPWDWSPMVQLRATLLLLIVALSLFFCALGG